MPRNIEIKARVHNMVALRERVIALTGEPPRCCCSGIVSTTAPEAG